MKLEDLEKIVPVWNSEKANSSFEIVSQLQERIPMTRLENWMDLNDLIESDFFNSSKYNFIYRGQKNYTWALTPSLARMVNSFMISEDLENRQLEEFKKSIRGRVSDLTLFTEEVDNDELWSIGQHHGLQTPLLDWTTSPFISLFFAFSGRETDAEKEANPYRAIYIINRCKLETELGLDGNIKFIEPRKDGFGRLISQAGLFSYTAPGKLIDAVIEELVIKSKGDITKDLPPYELAKYICKVLIKNKNEDRCLKYLRKMNIHNASLFPDLEGAVSYCNIVTQEAIKKKEEKAKKAEEKREKIASQESSKENKAEVNDINLNSEKLQSLIPDNSVGIINLDELTALLNRYASQYSVNEELSTQLFSELKKYLSIYDWQNKINTLEAIKATTSRVLRRNNYPQSHIENVVEEIIPTVKLMRSSLWTNNN